MHQDRTMRSGLGLCVLGLLCLHSSVFGQVSNLTEVTVKTTVRLQMVTAGVEEAFRSFASVKVAIPRYKNTLLQVEVLH